MDRDNYWRYWGVAFGGVKDAALQQLSLLHCRHEAIGDVGHIHQEMQAERQTYSASVLERF